LIAQKPIPNVVNRQEQKLRVNTPANEVFLGIEIGGTKLQLALGSGQGELLAKRKFQVAPVEGAAGIRKAIERGLSELLQKHKPTAIGVGFGGPVDWRTGKICRSHQIEGWSEFDLASWLQGLTGTRVVVDNDANIAALGEALLGAGVGANPVFYVTLGSGVGGGLIVDGRIYHGAIPGEAEIGHIRLDRRGTTLESRCSGWAIDARIRELQKTEPDSALARLAGRKPGAEAQHLLEALNHGDNAAARLIDEVTDDLSFGLSHVTHLFHPQVIVLGGGLARLGEPLRAAIQNKLSRFIMEAFLPGPSISLAGLGEDAVPVGALLLAAREPAK
jgi:glucokinase